MRKGQSLAEIETDKATFEVEAEQDGHVLAILHQPGETVDVGSVLFWLGATPDDVVVPEATDVRPSSETPVSSGAEPTLKAALLLSEYNLTADQVPCSGHRLTAVDVESFIRQRGLQKPKGRTTRAEEPAPVPAFRSGNTHSFDTRRTRYAPHGDLAARRSGSGLCRDAIRSRSVGGLGDGVPAP